MVADKIFGSQKSQKNICFVIGNSRAQNKNSISLPQIFSFLTEVNMATFHIA